MEKDNYDILIEKINQIRNENIDVVILQQDNTFGQLKKGFPEIDSIIKENIKNEYNDYEIIDICGIRVRIKNK